MESDGQHGGNVGLHYRRCTKRFCTIWCPAASRAAKRQRKSRAGRTRTQLTRPFPSLHYSREFARVIDGAHGIIDMPELAKIGWDDLRIILEVARQGSIYGAAKILKVDHSTVTRRIAHVEIILERRLFDRSNRGIQPLPDTEKFLTHIKRMELHAGALEEELGRSERTQVKTVRVATMEGLASGYLARRIDAISPGDNNVRIDLFSNPHIVDLLKKETDIFLSFFDPDIPGLVSERIGEIGIFLYGSELYRSVHGFPSSRTELSQHRYVGYIGEMISIESVRWLEEIVPDANVVFCSNSVIAQRAAAIAGAGLVVLPAFVGDEAGTLHRIMPTETRIFRPVWMSVGRDQHLLRSINHTAKAIAKIFASDSKFLSGERPFDECFAHVDPPRSGDPS